MSTFNNHLCKATIIIEQDVLRPYSIKICCISPQHIQYILWSKPMYNYRFWCVVVNLPFFHCDISCLFCCYSYNFGTNNWLSSCSVKLFIISGIFLKSKAYNFRLLCFRAFGRILCICCPRRVRRRHRAIMRAKRGQVTDDILLMSVPIGPGTRPEHVEQ